MNKQQIKEELRRSACEDEFPWYSCYEAVHPLDIAYEFEDRLLFRDDIELRMFLLFVAEAME